MDVRTLLYVDGAWSAPSSDRAIDVINPATERPIGRVPAADAVDVDRAVRAARAAQPHWEATRPAQRAAALRRLAAELEARREELADLLVLEGGIPWSLAHTHQTTFPIAALRSYADLIERRSLEDEIGHSLVVQEPVGVVAALAPWNFPLLLAMNKLAPALAAGCTVILKPSEQTPLHAFVVAECVETAELPAGVVNLVTGTGPVAGEALAAHPEVDLVSLTGSTAAGRRVAALAAPTLKRLTLELGGKSANIVLGDADLDAAVRRGVEQCYWNSGQNCMAWSRMLVPRRLQAEIVDRAHAAVEQQRLGPPSDQDTTIGPLISAAQAERVGAIVRDAHAQGASLVCGGAERPERFERGFYVQPTVFCDVENAMPIAREEIFGPVLTILPYDDVEQAVAIANDTPFGLHGAVFSGDPSRALAVARRLRTGMVDINGAPLNPEAPFGGRKQSGLGRELGVWGLQEYLEPKAIQLRL
jgi:aldehyde dehydrogenase (NAD+)